MDQIPESEKAAFNNIQHQILKGTSPEIKSSAIKQLHRYLAPQLFPLLTSLPHFLPALFRCCLELSPEVRLETIFFLAKLSLSRAEIAEIFDENFLQVIQSVENEGFRQKMRALKQFDEFIRLYYIVIHNVVIRGQWLMAGAQYVIPRVYQINQPNWESVLMAAAAYAGWSDEADKAVCSVLTKSVLCQGVILDVLYEKARRKESFLEILQILEVMKQNKGQILSQSNERVLMLCCQIMVLISTSVSRSREFINKGIIENMISILGDWDIQFINSSFLFIFNTVSSNSNGSIIIWQQPNFVNILIKKQLLNGKTKDCMDILTNVLLMTSWEPTDENIQDLAQNFLHVYRNGNFASSFEISIFIKQIHEKFPFLKDAITQTGVFDIMEADERFSQPQENKVMFSM